MAENPATLTEKASLHSWFVIVIAGLFFFFAFLQVNMFNAIDPYLLKDFHVSAAALGQLSAFYFIANVILLFPAGIVLDHISPHKCIIAALSLCVLGTFIFGIADYFWVAAIGRFMVGIGGAFSFLSCIKVASRWFPPSKLALVTGVIVTMAMLGGMVAQTPLTLLTDAVGWRHALFVDALIGVAFVGLVILFVRDYPKGAKEKIAQQQQELSAMGFWSSLGKVIINPQNWLGGLFTSLINLPVFLLGAMWGGLYLVQAHQLTRPEASIVTSMLFIGMIFGSPIFGWWSDHLGKRRPPMILGAVASLITILVIMYVPNLSMGAFIVSFLALGFFISSQVIGYPLVAESNPPALTGTGVGLASVIIMGGGLTQTLFGWLMGLHWKHVLVHNVPIYAKSDYHLAMLIMPFAFVAAIVIALLAKETHCQFKQEN